MQRRNSRALECDLQTSSVPSSLYWNIEEVAQWIEELGFPQYSICFRLNFINGRKLIAIDGSALPNMGIHDYEHIKKITESIRDLLGIEKVKKKEIAMKDPRYAYMEIKRRSGTMTDHLTYKDFLRTNKMFFPDHVRKMSM
ncbi:sterile alpha motif domain-containing protein 15-like [Mytilus galloprovincialis]|uniref:sterile alpha motif domain-containing protein 15-like n=1 Tax=Mytilus galloprovincialis TaxID=29158 RepID=UPI003F7B6DD9